MSNETPDIYAGDLTPAEAWEMLKSDDTAVLIDVRTDAEFAYVGVADLTELNKEAIYESWQIFPKMEVNSNFVADLATREFNKGQALLFLCRSGVRSKHAAVAMTQAGFTRCYNITGGFEGDKDAIQHRGTVNGWKIAGLPWVQK